MRSPVVPPPWQRSTGKTGRIAALPKWLTDIFDYESWAPKSSRVWRLQQYQYPEADAEARSTGGGCPWHLC
jgi:hypothetical protein